MPHDPANNGCPKNADSRNETCSCAEADERGGSTKGRAEVLSPDDRENIAKALEMRANYIETRDVLLSRHDLTIRAGGQAAPGARVTAALQNVAKLDDHQCALILRLRELARNFRSTR